MFRRRNGFSLVELVIVIVILGVIAAIAIPRISSGSKNAGDASLKANLSTLRNAVDWYYSEHNNSFPAAKGDGAAAANSFAAFESQLIQYSDATGKVSDTKSSAFPFGPYVRTAIPKLPVGAKSGNNKVYISSGSGPLAADTSQDAGWCYNSTTGQIIANCGDSEVGNEGTKYNSY